MSMWQRRIYPSLCFFLPRVEARFVGHASFSNSDEPAVGHRCPIALCTHSRKFPLPLPRHHLTPHPPYSFILLFDPTSDELGCCLRLYSLAHSLFSNSFFLSVFRLNCSLFPPPPVPFSSKRFASRLTKKLESRYMDTKKILVRREISSIFFFLYLLFVFLDFYL